MERIRENLYNKLDDASGHIGRAYKYPRMLSDWLAEKDFITPNRITVAGGVIGSVGAALVSEPKEFAELIARNTDGAIDLSERQVKLIGLAGSLLGYAADGLDGSVAHAREELGKSGYSKLGRLLDGGFDKLIENAGPQAILHFQSESRTEKPGWFLYSYFSNLTTLIRSVGIAHEIDIGKTGSGSRGDIEGVFGIGHILSSPFLAKGDPFWRGRGSHGAILTGMRIHSAYDRWKMINQSGNEEAISHLKKEIAEFTALNITGYAIGEALDIGGAKGQFIFGLAKVLETMSAEDKVNRTS